ncbi:hypothetical protein MPC4_170073 [Methylocella tundrae]|uniref:Uncharacterized protein n=1 Tax=Methylocella tundrae TaxID=227605 RepID=A0A8B6M624_METTU|nr:hypothetical protein MPC4_170073 [Methylocella tundrae]
MTRLGCPGGGVLALLQLWSAPPSSPGTSLMLLGFFNVASGLPCNRCVAFGPAAFAFGTSRPAAGFAGYICACSIQSSQTTKGYWRVLTGQVAATQSCHAVSAASVGLIAFGAAQGLSCGTIWAFALETPSAASRWLGSIDMNAITKAKNNTDANVKRVIAIPPVGPDCYNLLISQIAQIYPAAELRPTSIIHENQQSTFIIKSESFTRKHAVDLLVPASKKAPAKQRPLLNISSRKQDSSADP